MSALLEIGQAFPVVCQDRLPPVPGCVLPGHTIRGGSSWDQVIPLLPAFTLAFWAVWSVFVKLYIILGEALS